MKVLSLFDGIGCGLVALKQKGIIPSVYYRSEIDKYANAIFYYNHQDINYIDLGDVRHIKTDRLKNIYLLIAGSPCTNFSIAGKRNGITTKENIEIVSLNQYLELKNQGFEFEGQSYLFWEFIRILNEVRPKYFMLENVKMTKRWQKVIDNVLGFEPIEINSLLVSAQNRKRFYWIGKRINGKYKKVEIPLPENRNIILKNILEKKVDEKYYIKKNLEIILNKDYLNLNLNKKDNKIIKLFDIPKEIIKDNERQRRVYSIKGKSPTLLARSDSPKILDCNKPVLLGLVNKKNSQGNRVYSINGKSVTLIANAGGLGGKTGLYFDKNKIRKLTPLECERLQTLPDNYTQYGLINGKKVKISNTQRYKTIGNGWTVKVIEHIFGNLIDK
jgi:site-specific DNA-cytosine methylase